MLQLPNGTLYIVATPIGNLEDITARALRILCEVDMIAAEDTRHSRGLLSHFKIKTPLFSCHKFNEEKRGDFFIGALREGKNVALICDAGTPCISDPGHKIVKIAAESDIEIVPVCGASAVAAAVSVCGFAVSRFSFVGFLPRGKNAIDVNFFSATEVVVFYESPKRIISVLELLEKKFPDSKICLCNDISKKFERIYRGNAKEILEEIVNHPYEKGEYTCVVARGSPPPPPAEPEKFSPEARLVDIMIKSNCNLKDAAAKLKSIEQSFGKKEIYAAMLRLKNFFENENEH
ncbi:MAG: 16S rRNA (cytidine(1402)-2'-O)-methyltransferase [Defluviitaleaceae bacterium]|nr:16S rRNA (cytidine(1402)-2'-O)-methyltransferase [Defluviitaleaceae bacterium]